MTWPIGRWLDALRGRAPEPTAAAPAPDVQAQIREDLKWFNRFDGPPQELVDWFARTHLPLRGDGAPEALTLEAAMERRKWVLRGAADNPEDQHFEGRTNWLPLVAWGKNLLIYESGPLRSGLVLRQPDRRAQYVKDRARPIPLPTFEVARLVQAQEPDEAPEDDSVLDQLVPLVGVRPRKGDWSPGDRLPFFKDGVPRELIDWFNVHDGQLPGELWFPEERVGAKWRALSLDEAVVARDLVLEAATPALADRLQRDPRWLPLFSVNGDHFVLYAEDRGIALHVRAGAFVPVPWSRWSPLSAFLEASREVWAPQCFGPFTGRGALDLPEQIVAELQVVTADLEERSVQREGLSTDDARTLRSYGLSEELALALPAWFEPNVGRPGAPLLADGEHALSGAEAVALRNARDLGRPWFPLARCADGMVVAWVEKSGVAELRPDGSICPVSATFVGWLEGLLHAADAEREARVEPGSIRRSPMGVWTVDVAPLVAKDIVAALRALPWNFTRTGYTLTLERGAEVDVRAEARSRLVIQLPVALVDQMITDLEALEGYEAAQLHWEDVHDLVLVVRARS